MLKINLQFFGGRGGGGGKGGGGGGAAGEAARASAKVASKWAFGTPKDQGFKRKKSR